MSPGYRQAILNSKLLGQQSNPLVRDENGLLLTVDRRNSQAFLREPNQPFVVSSSGAAGLPAGGVGGGTNSGLGWGAAVTSQQLISAAVPMTAAPFTGSVCSTSRRTDCLGAASPPVRATPYH
jgi:hypothetical protein